MAPYSRLAVAALAALAVVLMAGGPRGCNGQAPAKAPAAPKPAANKPAPPPKPSPAASIMPAFGIQPVQFDDEEQQGPKLCQGKTPPRVVIQSVVAYPQENSVAVIVLRNVGGQTANLTGYRLTDSDTRTVEAAANYVFGSKPQCRAANATAIEPGRSLVLYPANDTNACGFTFGISFRDEVNLFDASDALVSSAKWTNSEYGAALHLLPGGTRDSKYRQLPEKENVVKVLEEMGGYSIFVDALKATGIADKLTAGSDPSYPGPDLPPPPPPPLIDPQFPWWFGYGVDRRTLPPPPPPPERKPPPPAEIPGQGPYTVLAPNDAAFDALLRNLGGGRKLPRDQLLKLPELASILRYHVLPGQYTTQYMFNNTPIYSAQSVDVTPFTDPCMTEGTIMLHDACIDKPTPDNYTCSEQAEFEKCYFPFMTSALAAQWQGGFCQRTCERCSCAADSGYTCAAIVQPDVLASNGVVHGITRVLFPPPVFNKSMYETLLTGDQLSELVPGMPGSKSSGAAAGPGGAGMIPGVPGLKPGMGVPTMMLPNASSPDAATKQQPPVKAQG